MNTLRQAAVEALEQEVHSDTGWLSDAQDAQLRVSYDSAVEFCGEGSIDLNHIVSIVLGVLEGEIRKAKKEAWDEGAATPKDIYGDSFETNPYEEG